MCRNLRLFAVATVGIIIALMLAASQAQASYSRQLLQGDITEFPPYCNCIRNSTTSPYSLSLDSVATVSGLFRYCFKVNRVDCDRTSRCCNQTQGVGKVEFEVDFGCKGTLRRVTVDGRNHTAWEFNKYGVVRVTSLNKTAADSENTTVCLFLRTNETCSQLENFCTINSQGCKYAIFQTDRRCCPVGITGFFPPPGQIIPGSRVPPPPAPPSPPAPPTIAAPPPPRSGFPNCTCIRDAPSSQIYIKPEVSVTQIEKNLTKICFELGTKLTCADPTSPCCKFAAFKVELEADVKCATALSYHTIDGVPRIRSFQYNPYPTIKITGINKAFEDVEGTELCVVMKPECNTLAALGIFKDGSITASVFNAPAETINCCPTAIVSETD